MGQMRLSSPIAADEGFALPPPSPSSNPLHADALDALGSTPTPFRAALREMDMPDLPTAAPFTGFSPEGLAFLSGLAEAQNRDWFEAHKAIYERELRQPMAALVNALGFAFAVHELDLACDPKRAIFRIHRDVRFSKDKRPYKTHIGASLTRSGEKLAPGLVYIHIDPTGSFVAGGAFRPEPPLLHKLRLRIRDRQEEILAITADLAAKGLTLSDDEALKSRPRGFEDVDDADAIALLKLKSLITRRDLPQDLVMDGDRLIAAIVTFTQQVYPLLRFVWRGVI